MWIGDEMDIHGRCNDLMGLVRYVVDTTTMYVYLD